MLKKTKSTSFAIGLALSLSFACHANALTEAEFKAIKLPYSVMAYSNQYAHEYGLDTSKAIDLPKGLEAVKLILYKKHYKGDPSKGWGTFDSYECSAELYVDKSLNLYWPGNYSKVDKVGDGGLQKAQISTVQLKEKASIGYQALMPQCYMILTIKQSSQI
ncbi:hypothetical protein DA717_07785 [Piscirickettsiaceae bacterium NZ-RLO2]|nr:hypothetical protein DA717_07785 [Piscirickettsiaceae bacterium NZ-RLO2]